MVEVDPPEVISKTSRCNDCFVGFTVEDKVIICVRSSAIG